MHRSGNAGGRRPASTPVAVVQEATCEGQRTVVGTLEDIATLAADIEPPAVIIIGEVVRLREKLNWYED